MKFSAIATSALLVALAAATEPTYDEELGCWPISVEHDATYCIDGPICSGSGAQPAGWKCPVAGDVAIADCHSYLVSYTGGDDCVLPVDATCQVIKTGAWGCVLSGTTPSPTSTGGGATPAPTSTGGGSTTSKPNTPTGNPSTPTPNPKTPTPTPTRPNNSSSGSGDEPGSEEGDGDISFSSVMTASSAGSVSAGAIAAIAAAAAAVCAAVGTVLYKKYHQTTPQETRESNMLEVVTP